MAEAKLLKRASGGIAEFSGTDTIPAANLPAVSVISPSQITSDQDNYSPTGWADADVVRLNFDSSGRAITGFAAWTNTRPKRVVNTSGNFGYISCEHPDSSTSNRVIGVCDHIIEPYGSLIIEYDDTSGRVRVIGNSFNPAAVSSFGRGHFYRASVGSNTAADFGDIAFANTGGGIDIIAATGTLPGCWGVYTLSPGNASSIYFAKTVLNPTYFGSAHIVSSIVVYFSLLSTSANTYIISHGIVPSPDSLTLDVNNSVTIQYTHGVNGGNFTGVVRDNSGAQSTVDLGVTMAINTLYVLTVCFDKAMSEARFYINGVMQGRVTGNMPNAVAVGDRTIVSKTVGSGAYNDFIACSKSFFTIY